MLNSKAQASCNASPAPRCRSSYAFQRPPVRSMAHTNTISREFTVVWFSVCYLSPSFPPTLVVELRLLVPLLLAASSAATTPMATSCCSPPGLDDACSPSPRVTGWSPPGAATLCCALLRLLPPVLDALMTCISVTCTGQACRCCGGPGRGKLAAAASLARGLLLAAPPSGDLRKDIGAPGKRNNASQAVRLRCPPPLPLPSPPVLAAGPAVRRRGVVSGLLLLNRADESPRGSPPPGLLLPLLAPLLPSPAPGARKPAASLLRALPLLLGLSPLAS